MMEAVRTSETSVDNHFTRQYNPEDSSKQILFYLGNPWWWRQYAPLKRRSTIILLGSTSQNTALNIILTAVRTWNLTYRRLAARSLFDLVRLNNSGFPTLYFVTVMSLSPSQISCASNRSVPAVNVHHAQWAMLPRHQYDICRICICICMPQTGLQQSPV
jgi:hypothetical protein